MEYSKEDLMEAKKQIWGVGENMGTEESKKIWEENAQFWDNAMGDEYIRYFSKVNGQVNAEVEDYVKQRLIDCQFKFRLDEPPDKS